ncbi:sulfotransferase [Dermatophilaceae bacterium Soc4.6]
MTSPPASSAPTRVLFVAGTGRSGTTILSSIIGQIPGAMSAGEIRYIWERGFTDDHRCGCGQPFSTCPVWSEVVALAYPDGPPDPGAVSRDLLTRLRMLRVPSMVWRQLRGGTVIVPDPHDEALAALYRAVAQVVRPSVIIDSSKVPPYGKLLERLPGIDLYVIQVIRDPRANAFSWQRLKETRDREGDDATMEQLELWRSAAMWLVWNYLVEFWWPWKAPKHLQVRYEEFVADPRATVDAVASMLDLDASTVQFVDERSISMHATHTVAGNPNRHDTGIVHLRRDDEWRTAMPQWKRSLVTLMTLPGLRHFGYGLRG